MKVALIQLAYDDNEPNAERIDRVVDLVEKQRGHDLVMLPELWSAGGFDYRAWSGAAQATDGVVAQRLSDAARSIGAYLHGGSIVERPADGSTGAEGKDLWNTSLIFGRDGRTLATYRKIHRFGFAGGEPKLMEAGEDLVTVEIDGTRAGLSTCYDLRFPELYRQYGDRDVELSLIPAAWPMARVEHWRVLLRARAIENQTFVLACNTAGTHAKTEMGGHSAVIDPNGVVLAEAGEGEEVLRAEIDPSLVAQQRESFPVLRDRRL
ncbi:MULTISPECIES: carbon-nitrogen family hydrolase [Yimella]|uniref:Putative amidohydrolase n=1 Tax=Yimella lutea TaxID=587872 RepID=A0A542ED37_9MICO|nr:MULTISPECIES: carbon-nitrogen family hydrolase [Yimella]MCG8656540.1 carbon-nitrogen family hydrolase [Yimella sp. NH-Cas1]RYG78536.1 carbon-nitrogen family hydrolase [Yimella sp. RIT 621]TQJ13225.1 putative amidohydrolase [Yimella lutea]